jgi:hypothetical protein
MKTGVVASVLLLATTLGIGVAGVVAAERAERSAAASTPTVISPLPRDPSPAPGPTLSPAPTPTITATPTPKPQPTATPTGTPEPAETATPSATPRPEPKPTTTSTPKPKPAPVTVAWDSTNTTDRFIPGGDPNWNMENFWLTDCDGEIGEYSWGYNTADCPTLIRLVRPNFWEPKGWWFYGTDNGTWFKNEQAYMIEIHDCEYVDDSNTVKTCKTSTSVEPANWNGEPIIEKYTPWRSTWTYDK